MTKGQQYSPDKDDKPVDDHWTPVCCNWTNEPQNQRPWYSGHHAVKHCDKQSLIRTHKDWLLPVYLVQSDKTALKKSNFGRNKGDQARTDPGRGGHQTFHFFLHLGISQLPQLLQLSWHSAGLSVDDWHIGRWVVLLAINHRPIRWRSIMSKPFPGQPSALYGRGPEICIFISMILLLRKYGKIQCWRNIVSLKPNFTFYPISDRVP